MLEKICYIKKNHDSYQLKTRSQDSLKNKCLIKQEHYSNYIELDSIFDFREDLIKHENEIIYFYLVLFNNNMEEIQIKENNLENSEIFYVTRRSNKYICPRFNYNNSYSKKENKLVSSFRNNIIYLGKSELLNDNLAKESSNCFLNNSTDGDGFFKFSIKLNNLNNNPKYGLIVGYNEEFINSESNIFEDII
tara:strand:+ start:842 stop:1417 length:576 start_codon:yes stop_codon:yes gene_type:complete